MDGFGFDVGGYGESIATGTAVYPLFGGTVLYAGCATGTWSNLGKIVYISTVVDGNTYTAVYSHLSSIPLAISAKALIDASVGPNDQIGGLGDTTTVGGNCDSGSGPNRLHVSLWQGGTYNNGELDPGTPVLPEPLIGASAYEKFTWWSGPMTATDMVNATGTPGGDWGSDSASDGTQFHYGTLVHLSATWSDNEAAGVEPLEIRFTAYYPGWAAASPGLGFDPTTTWRVLADCRYGDNSQCTWDASTHTVSYDWDPTAPGASRLPWLPTSKAAASSNSCIAVVLSFDVYDTAGYRNLAPNGTGSAICPGSQGYAPKAGLTDGRTGIGGGASLSDDVISQRAIYLLPFDSSSDCDTSWASPVSGDWSNALLWTNGVPDATRRACITTSGPYGVTISGSSSAKSIVVGSPGTTSPTLTLTRGSYYGYLVSDAGGLTNYGTLVFNGPAGYAPNLTLGGALVNHGTIQTTGTGPNITADLDNEGTLDLQGGAQLSGVTFTNNGTVSVASTMTLTVSASSGTASWSEYGTLTVNGSLCLLAASPGTS